MKITKQTTEELFLLIRTNDSNNSGCFIIYLFIFLFFAFFGIASLVMPLEKKTTICQRVEPTLANCTIERKTGFGLIPKSPIIINNVKGTKVEIVDYYEEGERESFLIEFSNQFIEVDKSTYQGVTQFLKNLSQERVTIQDDYWEKLSNYLLMITGVQIVLSIKFWGAVLILMVFNHFAGQNSPELLIFKKNTNQLWFCQNSKQPLKSSKLKGSLTDIFSIEIKLYTNSEGDERCQITLKFLPVLSSNSLTLYPTDSDLTRDLNQLKETAKIVADFLNVELVILEEQKD